MERLGVVVAGTGFGCVTHVRALRAAGFEVRAVVGRDPAKTAERAWVSIDHPCQLTPAPRPAPEFAAPEWLGGAWNGDGGSDFEAWADPVSSAGRRGWTMTSSLASWRVTKTVANHIDPDELGAIVTGREELAVDVLAGARALALD